MIEMTDKTPPEVDQYRQRALIVGVAGLVLCGLGAVVMQDATQFFRSYLLAFIFWIGIALGSFAILMVQHMSGGAWGLVIRRLLESATRTFPLLLLLFIPIAIGVTRLYVWTNPDAPGLSAEMREILHHKQPYLNVTFFLIRAAFYFFVWIGVTYYLNKWSLEQDRTGVRYLTRKMQVLSGPGLLLYGFTVTFSSIDWVMSLSPEWFSTIWGILFMGGQGLSAMAFMIAALVLLSNRKPLSDVIAPSHLHDLGKLMLAFLMLWAYFSFSQFLIIWSGNIPEEAVWYTRRLHTGWRWVGLALVLLHFALPFVLLLSRDLKRSGRTLAIVAIAIIIMRYVDLIWLTGPEFGGGHFAVSWMDLVMPFGVGGIWMAFFLYQLKTRPLIPVQDPYLEDVLNHGGGH
ncbi:MAG TPA: hypothetical protein VNI02_04025 [Blastocatellia bacterium]|jgi:hypothetical protein|nr:hypothetical protein [Blastocatellia bacterium]